MIKVLDDVHSSGNGPWAEFRFVIERTRDGIAGTGIKPTTVTM